ncbi:MAG: hypothetical protein COA45_04040 [Zetaproteobacteria bacterium]|nr:MAG: hypothetical protein COA45_04040 [Zetaproteobacteria bacterium]
MTRLNSRLWISFIFIVLLTGCVPSDDKQEPSNDVVIKQGVIGGKKYYVPEMYFKMKGGAISLDSIYVSAMYPTFTPMLEDHKKLRKEKEWYRNVRILASYRKNLINPDEVTKIMIKNLKAFEVVGEEYGLIHQKQPEEYVQDKRDMWLDKVDGHYVSYISCSDKILETDVPQCSHTIYVNSFSVGISYNKVLLPHWKEIKRNVLEMFESFEYEHSARAYIETKLNGMNLETHGERK